MTPDPLPPRLLVTIDTECDKSRSWHTSTPLAFRGIAVGVRLLLQPLFDEFGIRPTYLISGEVLADRASVDLLGSLANVELATHLHGDYVAPIEMRGDLGGTITDEMQWEYGPTLEAEKLKTLTDAFVGAFGRRPTSFRAGRFGIGPHSGRILRALGYRCDSSVTPHMRWKSRLGFDCPDFSNCPEHPYAMREDGNLFAPGDSDFLELPVTLVRAPGTARDPAWLRPWFSDGATLCRIVEQVCSEPPRDGISRPLVMMFHNMEIIPGASPYPQSVPDVDRYLQSLRQLFAFTTRKGIAAVTMDEYAAEWRARRTSAAAPAAAPAATAA